MVGLPGSGKTTRARELEREHRAVRLSPDEWAMPLLGTVRIGDLRDRLEGMLLDLAVPALAAGAHVVVDFGLWSREERSALRWVAAQLGSGCRIEYLNVTAEQQRERVRRRAALDPLAEEDLSDTDLAAGWDAFQPPTTAEIAGTDLPAPPPGEVSWGTWAAARWPGLRTIT